MENLLKLLMFLVIFIFASCSNNIQKENFKPDPQVEIYIREWKDDKYGCKKLRTKDKAEVIVDSLKLQNVSDNEFMKIFDIPDRKREYNGVMILEYYFDAVCLDGKFIDSADFCIAAFTFTKNKLSDRSYICK